MTIVAGLADPVSNTAILLADSRITRLGDDAHFDVCQKVINLGHYGLCGFAGPINEAATTANWITGTFKELGPAWLTDEASVMGMLHEIGAFGQPEPNSFLAAFMNEGNRATLVRFDTNGDYNRTTAGIEMIGTGAGTYDAIRPLMTKIMNMRAGEGGAAVGERAFLLAHLIDSERKNLSIDSVGGLMQIHFVEQGGSRSRPYDHWVDIDELHGTRVKMDIDDTGCWVQIQEPTGFEVPLRFPGEHDFDDVHKNFELERSLDKNSPGVELRPDSVPIYMPYLSNSGDWLVRTATVDESSPPIPRSEYRSP